MKKIIVTSESSDAFFKRGRVVAAQAELGEFSEDAHILSFEDPQDMLHLLTESRINLFRAIKEMPGSITDVAARLHRDRSAVKRDVDLLAEAGVVSVTRVLHPGHGQKKEVRAIAEKLILRSEVG